MLHHLKRWDRSLLLWMQEHLRKGGVTLFMKITTFSEMAVSFGLLLPMSALSP